MKFYKKAFRLISKEQNEILETALLSMIPLILTKILGFLFGLIAATKFGNLDQGWQNFLLANTIPEFITNVIIAGTIGSIIIPTLVTSKINESKEEFLRLFSTLLNFCILILALISFVLILFGDNVIPVLLNILSGEVNISSKDLSMVISSTKILLIPQILLGISTFVSSGLNVYNRFIIPHFAPVFYNVGRLFGLITLYPVFGIDGLIYGIIIGSFLHLVIQLPQALSVGFRYIPVFDFNNKYLKEVFVIAIPRFFTLAVENILRLVSNFFAFGFRGGISALYFAEQVISFIPLVFSFTFATAAYPKMSSHFEKKELNILVDIIIKTFNQMLFLVIPVLVTLLILRVPIARLFFGSLPDTALSMYETYAIAWNILLFSVGTVFLGSKWFMYRAFYATKDTKTPLLTSVLSFFVSILCMVLFMNLFSFNKEYAISDTKITIESIFSRGDSVVGVGGIPLGLSIGYIVEFALLIYLFNKKINLQLKNHFLTFLKKFIAGSVMAVVMYMLYRIWFVLSYFVPERAQVEYLGSTTINLFLLTFTTCVVSFIVYCLVCFWFKVEELKIFARYLNPTFKIIGLKIK